MMKNTKSKKLALAKESVKLLSGEALEKVAGGTGMCLRPPSQEAYCSAYICKY